MERYVKTFKIFMFMKKINFYVFAALTIMMLPTACIEELPGSPELNVVLSEPYGQFLS